MSDQLKPCPFCGGAVDPSGWLRGDGARGPECESCGATAPTLQDWNTRAQPSDGAFTNEPFCYTTPGMVEVAKAIKAGSGVGRIGARMVKDARFCVPLHLSAPAPATVMLPPAPDLPEEPPFADDDSYMDAYHAARRMRTACAKAIEAAGLKVEQ